MVAKSSPSELFHLPASLNGVWGILKNVQWALPKNSAWYYGKEEINLTLFLSPAAHWNSPFWMPWDIHLFICLLVQQTLSICCLAISYIGKTQRKCVACILHFLYVLAACSFNWIWRHHLPYTVLIQILNCINHATILLEYTDS